MAENIYKELGFRIAHIGINSTDEKTARETAKVYAKLFGFDYKSGDSSMFSAEHRLEIMKKPGRGDHGHIAIGTNDLEKAVKFISDLGYEFDYDSAVIREGAKAAIYLKEQIAGFAIHLVRN